MTIAEQIIAGVQRATRHRPLAAVDLRQALGLQEDHFWPQLHELIAARRVCHAHVKKRRADAAAMVLWPAAGAPQNGSWRHNAILAGANDQLDTRSAALVELIAGRRLDQGLTQSECAQALGVSLRAVGHYLARISPQIISTGKLPGELSRRVYDPRVPDHSNAPKGDL